MASMMDDLKTLVMQGEVSKVNLMVEWMDGSPFDEFRGVYPIPSNQPCYVIFNPSDRAVHTIPYSAIKTLTIELEEG